MIGNLTLCGQRILREDPFPDFIIAVELGFKPERARQFTDCEGCIAFLERISENQNLLNKEHHMYEPAIPLDKLKSITFPIIGNGYLKVIDWMGTEEDIIRAARMSTDKGFQQWEPGIWEGQKIAGDHKLLRTLMAKRHTTPFEMVELAVEVQAPLMVFREWHRHRTQSYNEFSARYSVMPNEHYVPAAERIQKQSTMNKQGSAEALPLDVALGVVEQIKQEQEDIYEQYESFIEEGIAKEVARIDTPVSRMSRCRAKTDLHNWLSFLRLRTPDDAQWEIRQYALGIAWIVKQLWPRTYELWVDHVRTSLTLSFPEVQALDVLLAPGTLAGGLLPEPLDNLRKKVADKVADRNTFEANIQAVEDMAFKLAA